MNTADARLSPTRDHVIPRKRNGKEIVVCCLTCNGIKGDMMPEAWAEFMRAHPGWWAMTRAERRAALRIQRELKRGKYEPPAAPAKPLKRHPTAGLIYTTGELTRPNAMVETLATIIGSKSRPHRPVKQPIPLQDEAAE